MNRHIPAPATDYEAQYTAPARELLFIQAAAYLSDAELARLEQACAFACEAHLGQTRKSGEPYITHPIAVTAEMAKWRADIDTLCAGLMHDVLEDTPVSYADMAARFGNTVTDLVDGVSKLDKFEFSDKAQHQAESFSKLAMAMTRDVRVIVIKLADRLHNMRTLEGVSKSEKRRSTAKETLGIHAPFAHRLGLHQVYREMQDLAFRQLHPDRYRILQEAMARFRHDYGDVIGTVRAEFADALAEHGIRADIIGREKHLYSIYQKMQSRRKHFNEVLDIYSFCVVVAGGRTACYTALGVLHGTYRPDLGRFKDHIAIPKSNGYQSLHTRLHGPRGLPLEIQIRTRDMHAVSENGITAILEDQASDSRRTADWLQSVLNLKEQSDDAKEFMEHIKNDLFQKEIYVYTPKGRIITLQRGSTPVDFAYAIHTHVGHHCIGAKIKNKAVPLSTRLRNGDQVEIVTSVHGRPHSEWLNFVRSARARSAIRRYLKDRDRNDAIELGKGLLGKALESLLPEENGGRRREELCRSYDDAGGNSDELLYRIGAGEIKPLQAAATVLHHTGGLSHAQPVRIDAGAGGRVRLGTCCRPVAGEAVGALMEKGHGLSIHRENCTRLLEADPDSRLEAAWESLDTGNRGYDTALEAVCADRQGLLALLTTAIADTGANINAVQTLSEADETGSIAFRFDLRVRDMAQLEETAAALRGLAAVREVVRP